MRTSILLMTILSFGGLTVVGQDSLMKDQPQRKEVKTLFSDAKLKGAYIAAGVKSTTFFGRPSLLTGADIALVLGHKFNFGVTGYGLITDVKSNALAPDGEPYYLTMGYGGLIFEPVIASHSMIHVTLPITLAIGGVGLNEHRLISYSNDWQYTTYGVDYDFFVLAEPGINLELNVFKVLRLDAGVSYRFPGDARLLDTKNSDLKGFNTNITLKLGAF